jgi:hypothetical protein
VARLVAPMPRLNVFTFGYGADHSAEALTGIAEAGRGVYYFLETTEQVATAFGDCLGGLVSVVAQNVQVG